MTRAVRSRAVVVYLQMVPRSYVLDLPTVSNRVGAPAQTCASGIVLLGHLSCR
jgi:hypothetical protein